MRYLDYPYTIDGRGRSAGTGYDEHIRDLLEQVLFTAPGERVNRPDFGTGVMQLVFAPSGDELATATQFLVQGALNRWLGELIQVEAVEVQAFESTLEVIVTYVVRRDRERRVSTFRRTTA